MDRKQKKKLILQRNKRHQIINRHAEQHALEHERQREEEEKQRAAALAQREQAEGEEQPWSARTQDILNRLTKRKRHARERWNRYAGTSGAGAMGR